MSFPIKKTASLYFLLLVTPLGASSLPQDEEQEVTREQSRIQTAVKKILWGMNLTCLGCLSILIRLVPDDYSTCAPLSNPSALDRCHQLRNSASLYDAPLEIGFIVTGATLATNGALDLCPSKADKKLALVKDL